MLQRAASNAYSWWWASHIRTKQSKWLQHNLQDMEEKVQNVLKLIEEDGDSFAKRAEMYYKKRPELIHFVEESYRAYRALAERYDHISTELQNANTTIASVFPEQAQFAMEDDEDDAPSRFPKKAPEVSRGNVPEVPKTPKALKNIFSSDAKKLRSKKSMKITNQPVVAKSGLSKSEGLKEIDKLQKQVLALQTEKEFVKSSYEGALAKYWEIEKMIIEMQKKVCSLQDEFGAGTVIEDDEARTLMASAALKSCQDTLAQLLEEQEKFAEEAMVENIKINDAREKLESLKDAFLHGKIDQEGTKAKDKSTETFGEKKNVQQEQNAGSKERQDLELLSSASLNVSELAEKIDELVNKVISLEAAESSQTGLILRLRIETDELQAQIGVLEDGKALLIDGKNDLGKKMMEMEEKLFRLEELKQSLEDQNNNLQTHFAEAQYHPENVSLNQKTNDSANPLEQSHGMKLKEKTDEQDSPKTMEDILPVEEKEQATQEDDEPDWKHLFINGMEDREKFLLSEYTTALRNYKDVKKKLGEAEQKIMDSHGDGLFDMTLQLRELKSANAKKDEQIKVLRQKLSRLQISLDEDTESEKSTLTESSTIETEAILMDHSEVSGIEQKFRMNIDEVLEENLDFWLRFSSTFHQIGKFETETKDLHSELVKLKEKKRKQDGSSDQKYSLKSDAKPLYKHLKQIHTELGVWLETIALLKDELKSRFSSLCDIQEEITAALKESAEDDEFTFTTYQAAKFQGEILNMKQENNKVADELQAGLDHVTALRLQVEKSLAKLNDEFKLSGSKNPQNDQLEHSDSRPHVPLRYFIFGVKPKRQRHSIFSCVHPILQRKYNDIKSGLVS